MRAQENLTSIINAPAAETAFAPALHSGAAWRSYVRLIRFHYHVTYVGVALGALLITRQFTTPLAVSLLLLYLSFNVLLYGGIYTMNGITDLASDAKDRFKSGRPLPRREISVKSAIVFSAALISSGLVSSSLLFDRRVVYLLLVFLALNVLYSFVARDVPYVELAVNAATHPLRFLLGASLANGTVPFSLLLGIFFLAIGLVVTRRSLDRDRGGWAARPTVESYSRRAFVFLKLAPLIGILGLLIVDASVPWVFYLLILGVYSLLVIGADSLKPIRRFLAGFWMR